MAAPARDDDHHHHDHHHDHDHDHDRGLGHDLAVLTRSMQRRRALVWLAARAASAAGLSACSAAAEPAAPGSCSTFPEQTAGPYPADGSNTAAGGTSNAMMLSGIVRSDIRASIAGATGVARGVPLTLVLQLADSNAACADLSGYAIYLWHCDRDGAYSLYSEGVSNENYLRGVQRTGADGKAGFTTIFPGCYPVRMPHLHFEVYRDESKATSYANKLMTSQIALPADICKTVYEGAAGYATSAANLSRLRFVGDRIFGDDAAQRASVTGSVEAGYTATLRIAIAA